MKFIARLTSRLTPSMPANLAQNLDQQNQNSDRTTPRPRQNPFDAKYESRSQVTQQPPQLPLLESSLGPKRRSTDDSYAESQYSLPSGVDEYLKTDFPPVNQSTRPPQPNAKPIRQNPYETVATQPQKPDPYSAYAAQESLSQASKLDPYGAYA